MKHKNPVKRGMNTQSLLRQARNAGVTLYIAPDGHLHALGPHQAVAQLLPVLVEHRDSLRSAVPQFTPAQHLSSTTRH